MAMGRWGSRAGRNKRKRPEDAENSGEEIASPAKSRKTLPKQEGDMARFGKYLYDADIARIELEREKLKLERDRLAAEREERKLERENSAKLELEKMKLMISALKKKE